MHIQHSAPAAPVAVRGRWPSNAISAAASSAIACQSTKPSNNILTCVLLVQKSRLFRNIAILFSSSTNIIREAPRMSCVCVRSPWSYGGLWCIYFFRTRPIDGAPTLSAHIQIAPHPAHTYTQLVSSPIYI